MEETLPRAFCQIKYDWLNKQKHFHWEWEHHRLLAMLLIFIAESHLSAMHLNFVYAQEYVAIKFILVKKQLSSGNLLSFFFYLLECATDSFYILILLFFSFFLLLHIDGKHRFQKKTQWVIRQTEIKNETICQFQRCESAHHACGHFFKATCQTTAIKSIAKKFQLMKFNTI